MTDRKMKGTIFITQTERTAFEQIEQYSELPSFRSSLTVGRVPIPEGKAAVPILDPEATATYYAVCLKGEGWKRLEAFMLARLSAEER
jgi:hypothetical protein